MRNIIFIGMLVATAFTAGWFKIQRDGEHTLIEINRAEIRSDAKAAIEKGREILDRERQNDAVNYEQPQQQAWPPQQAQPWGPANDGRYQSQPTQPIGYDYRQSPTYQAPAYQGQPYSSAYPSQPYGSPYAVPANQNPSYQDQGYPAQPASYPNRYSPSDIPRGNQVR